MSGVLRILSLLLIGMVIAPGPARAHPHEFVDTGLTFRFDDKGMLGAISVAWLYDDLTSLLILEDLGLDPDGDGKLTDEETARLTEMAGNWPKDFDGNLYLTAEGLPVALSGPIEATAGLRDGRLFMTHIRALVRRIDPVTEHAALQAYDPSYYTFCNLKGVPGVVGREGCEVTTEAADTAVAQKLYNAVLAELTDEEIMEQGKFPEIGGAFAPTLRLTCGR